MEAQLVSFGNYLLERYGVMVHSTDGKNEPIYSRQVCDADLCNWRDGNPELNSHTYFPSLYKQGDKVKVFLMPEGEGEFPGFPATVTGIHFFTGKVKYDLELNFAGGWTSRIYNVDSILVSDL